MGNRSYLTVANTIQLFESNKSLPVFWLLGLTLPELKNIKEDINQLQQILIEQYQETAAYQEYLETFYETTELGIISIELTDYLTNLQVNQRYIMAVYPNLINLYTDFIALIEKEDQFFKAAIIEMSYLEYLNFYENYLDFYLELEELFLKVEKQELITQIYFDDIVGTTTGYDTYSNHHSETLITSARETELLKEFKQEIVLAKEKLSFFQRLFKRN